MLTCLRARLVKVRSFESCGDIPGKKPSMASEDKPPPLSPTDVTSAIRRILEEGRVIPTRHIRQGMRQCNFDIQEVMQVLEHERVTRHPEWNENHHEWNYDIEGADIEGDS